MSDKQRIQLNSLICLKVNTNMMGCPVDSCESCHTIGVNQAQQQLRPHEVAWALKLYWINLHALIERIYDSDLG
ncbi:MAG: hypothetical protein D4R65_10130 [Verrucomicrobiaceae bacterium]|nr:MAG: hypothetical protein D4R65_10130 [Verrucomicrobiaceae bacterium]